MDALLGAALDAANHVAVAIADGEDHRRVELFVLGAQLVERGNDDFGLGLDGLLLGLDAVGR